MYIKISDFARIIDKSEEEVYKLLRGKLHKYRNPDLLKREIDTKALKVLGIEYIEPEEQQEQQEQPENEPEESTENASPLLLDVIQAYKVCIEDNRKEIARLNTIIEQKDKRIEELQNELNTTNKQLIELVIREQELNKNNQLLLKAEQDKLLIEAEQHKKSNWFFRLFKKER